MDRQRRWDEYGMSLAREGACMSRDPSTQVGASIMRPDGTIAAVSWNGFPRGIADDGRLYDRQIKYQMIIHAEINSILACRENMSGYTLYVSPLHPCAHCASVIVQSGIKRVVFEQHEEVERWQENFQIAKSILTEGGVSVTNFSMSKSETLTEMSQGDVSLRTEGS